VYTVNVLVKYNTLTRLCKRIQALTIGREGATVLLLLLLLPMLTLLMPGPAIAECGGEAGRPLLLPMLALRCSSSGGSSVNSCGRDCCSGYKLDCCCCCCCGDGLRGVPLSARLLTACSSDACCCCCCCGTTAVAASCCLCLGRGGGSPQALTAGAAATGIGVAVVLLLVLLLLAEPGCWSPGTDATSCHAVVMAK
jgi:hypothetical protein